MTRILAAGGGFLLAVLWMDLMFDVQAREVRRDAGAAREAVIASIASYYRRVTTDAFPMNRLIGAVMLVTVGGSVVQAVGVGISSWQAWLSPLLSGLPVGLAALRVVPNAVRLGARRDPIDVQHEIAHAILRDHVLCFVAIAAFIAIELSW